MSLDWTWWIALIGLCPIAGVAADAWMTHTQKYTLHDRMTRWFCTLDTYSIPQYPLLMAQLVLRWESWVTQGRWRRALLAAVLGSITLTTLALILGIYLTPDKEWSWPQIEWSWAIAIETLIGILGFYGPNFTFDLLCVIITIRILRRIRGQVLLDTLWVLCDVCLAFAGAILCGVTLLMVLNKEFFIPTIGDFIDHCVSSHPFVLYINTVFLPIVGYFTIFYIMVFARVVMALGRGLSLKWFDVATEVDVQQDDLSSSRPFKPWSLLGTSFGLLVGLLKVGKELVSGSS